jgi:dipeptidyl aminopeptidase/acylaminoacyl peptidase
LSGWLYRANGEGAVISLHGGPMQQEGPAMNATYQAMVAAGITVFAPNIRGSSGFGKRFMSLDDGPLRLDAIADVKAAADWLRAEGAKRIGVMGESYGGWLALETATRHPELFAAIVDSYGMTDLKAMIEVLTEADVDLLVANFGKLAAIAGAA